MSADRAIVTLTTSPAFDVSSAVERVVPTHKLRCEPPRFDPGGGGVNVSRVVRRLGEPTVVVAPLAGPFGAEVQRLLEGESVRVRRSRHLPTPARAS